ncbi:VOC family protein [Alteromonas aestuariivivens]|uniref:VOC family protein n=1 Tax=Alteromonas aestuariivivens TaxID=1938339 RepID=A0A3D8M4Q8_9ALTE|nr:VOC family protein [Alteromonas aestuariivivens]RDV24560.1 VOC family protein [Alteromonas aestuariivivens]
MNNPNPCTISSVTLLVEDYDAAIAFFTQVLRFELLEDQDLGNGARWVRLIPSGTEGTALVLTKATSAAQRTALGKQAGDGVFAILHSRNFTADYEYMRTRGVEFDEPPRQEPYGTVAIFRDLCGNKWDLIEPATLP